jgi:hypothetical protein
MQWISNDENKRRNEAFAEFIGGVAYEEDGGWSKEVWDAAWSARREWVGLTDEEIDDCFGMDNGFSPYDAIKKAEAKLKEKNNV